MGAVSAWFARRWPLFAIGGLFLSILAAAEMSARANLTVDGIVISSELRHPEGARNRESRAYVLQSPSGEEFQYSAGPNDHSLSQSIPNGARVIKKKGKMTYTVDGRTIDDFPTGVYSVAGAGGALVFIMGSIASWKRFRRYYKGLDNPR